MITLRRANFNDVTDIHAMVQQVYAEYRALLPHSSVWHETPEVITAEMQLGPVLLALVDGKLVGSVRCHVEHEEGQGDFMYIHRLAVLPNYRRQGLGRTLMQAVEDMTREANLHEVRLEMRAGQPENYHFYLKLGYEPGAVSGYLPDGSPRSYWMSKDLTKQVSKMP